MTIKVIVELKAKPGGRDELRGLFENMLAQQTSASSGPLRPRTSRKPLPVRAWPPLPCLDNCSTVGP